MQQTIPNAASTRPLRVLHVVEGMNCGGIESWLMHILRNSDRRQIEHDFLVLCSTPGYFDSEIEQFGSKIFRLPCHHQNVLKRRYAFHQIIKENGPYDAAHGHNGWYSGITMRYAAECQVPVRVTHVHFILRESFKQQMGVTRKFYIKRMLRFIDRYATHGIACSEEAGKAFWENSWGEDSGWITLCCGFDLKPFEVVVDKAQIRHELRIPANAFVIGNIGRLEIAKNHSFIIDIMRELIKLKENSVLLLVGSGSLQPVIQEKVEQFGLQQKVIFAGVRSDIPRLLKGAIDCFLLPSLNEGMGLAGIEAQAAGVPCVISNHIPLASEGSIVPGLVHPIPLKSPAAVWAKQIYALQCGGVSQSPKDALMKIKNSKFNIERSANALTSLYCQFNSTGL